MIVFVTVAVTVGVTVGVTGMSGNSRDGGVNVVVYLATPLVIRKSSNHPAKSPDVSASSPM